MSPQMRDVLFLIIKANPDGSFVDLDQILLGIPAKRSKQSMQFTIRSLVERGLIVKKNRETRRDRSRVTYAATLAGYQAAKHEKDPYTGLVASSLE